MQNNNTNSNSTTTDAWLAAVVPPTVVGAIVAFVVGVLVGMAGHPQPSLQATYNKNMAVARQVCSHIDDDGWTAARLGTRWYYEQIN